MLHWESTGLEFYLQKKRESKWVELEELIVPAFI